MRHYQQVHWVCESSRCHVCDIAIHPHYIQEHALKRHFVSNALLVFVWLCGVLIESDFGRLVSE